MTVGRNTSGEAVLCLLNEKEEYDSRRALSSQLESGNKGKEIITCMVFKPYLLQFSDGRHGFGSALMSSSPVNSVSQIQGHW